MEQYHKIQTVYLRDPETNYKKLLMGNFAVEEFRYLQDNEWTFTEKVDGTNIRVIYDNAFRFYGKTDNAQIPKPLLNRLGEIFFPLADKFKIMFNDPVCLYGEGYGAGINKGGKYKQNQDFVLFDIKIGDYWLLRSDVEEIATTLGIDIVPIIGKGTLSDMVDMVKDGLESKWGRFEAEGIIAKPTVELATRRGHRIITKIKHKDL